MAKSSGTESAADQVDDRDAFRQRLYNSYVSNFKQAHTPQSASVDERAKWRTWMGYIRGWLPADKSAKVLDIGCGTGDLLRALRDLGYSDLCGIDLSPEMVALARRHLPQVEEGDALAYLANHDQMFDCIIAIDVIEHVSPPQALALLDQCHAALRDGGRLVLQTPNGASPLVGETLLGDLSHEHCFTPQSLQHLLRLAGFDCSEVREQGPIPHGVPSVIRWGLWQILRLGVATYNLVETGSARSSVLSRVFLASAVKGEPRA